MSLGAYAVSDDGRLLAYSTDITGFREYTLYVKDLETGALLPDPGREDRVGGLGRRQPHALLHRRGRGHEAAAPPVSPRLGSDRARPRLRGEGRGFQRRRRPHAQRRLPRPRHRQPHHLRGALPAGRRADRRVAAGGAAHRRAGVRRRPPRRAVLDPHQRPGPQLPPRDGAGREPRPGELGGGRCRTDRT